MNPASRHRIILASSSPRRRELAVAEGWDVHIVPPPEAAEADAAVRMADETLEGYVLRLARAKGKAVAARGAAGTILACDTVGEIDGTVLGKPVDRADARRMLILLSGRIHRVLTGVWIGITTPTTERQPRPTHECEAVEESLLAMDPLDDELLEWYLDSGLWRGKAGACGFQDARLPLRLISGSGSNVVGLPLERIRLLLDRLPRPADETA